MKTIKTAILLLILSSSLNAAVYNANPGNYLDYREFLQAGDTLILENGVYKNGFRIDNMNGTPEKWIVIKAKELHGAIFEARSNANTMDISNSSYIKIIGLKFLGRGLQNIDAIKAGGSSSEYAHHIVIQDNYISGHGGNQQTVGISTKTPCWDWIIRGNEIIAPGTGIYLGNSDGSMPFIRGIIENNLILEPRGYCMQIKHQDGRPDIEGIPVAPTSTIIRHNVFIKDDRPSPDGDRPNLLVGGQPLSGPGFDDRVEIYGNFFYDNPREYLFQGTGNISLHDNIFVSSGAGAVNCMTHNGREPRELLIYCNTIYSTNVGINISGASQSYLQSVNGNAVFCNEPVKWNGTGDNLAGEAADADKYLNKPSTDFDKMDFYPKSGMVDTELDMSDYKNDTDWDKDFNGQPQEGMYYGAYSGSGQNPGWQPAAEKKDYGLVVGVTGGFFKKSDDHIVYPNPSDGAFNFYIHGQASNEAELLIFDMRGSLILHETYTLQAGNYCQIKWGPGPLPAGIFIYEIHTGKKVYTGKIIKK